MVVLPLFFHTRSLKLSPAFLHMQAGFSLSLSPTPVLCTCGEIFLPLKLSAFPEHFLTWAFLS